MDRPQQQERLGERTAAQVKLIGEMGMAMVRPAMEALARFARGAPVAEKRGGHIAHPNAPAPSLSTELTEPPPRG